MVVPGVSECVFTGVHLCFVVQVAAVHEDLRLALGGGHACDVRCYLTGDGKAMQAMNYAPGHCCWMCRLPRATWLDNLAPSGDVCHGLRYGAFLRAIPSSQALE